MDARTHVRTYKPDNYNDQLCRSGSKRQKEIKRKREKGKLQKDNKETKRQMTK